MNTDHLAIEAAKVALQIAMSYESSEPVVVRSSQFQHLHEAVSIALDAAHRYSEDIDYVRVPVSVEYSCHGVHAQLDEVTIPDTGFITAVVTIHAELPIHERALPAILSDAKSQIECANEDTYIAEWIYVIAHEMAA